MVEGVANKVPGANQVYSDGSLENIEDIAEGGESDLDLGLEGGESNEGDGNNRVTARQQGEQQQQQRQQQQYGENDASVDGHLKTKNTIVFFASDINGVVVTNLPPGETRESYLRSQGFGDYVINPIPSPTATEESALFRANGSRLVGAVLFALIAIAEFASDQKSQTRKDYRAAQAVVVEKLLQEADTIMHFANEIFKMRMIALVVTSVGSIAKSFGSVGKVIYGATAVFGQVWQAQIAYKESQGQAEQKRDQAEHESARTISQTTQSFLEEWIQLFNEIISKVSQMLDTLQRPHSAT